MTIAKKEENCRQLFSFSLFATNDNVLFAVNDNVVRENKQMTCRPNRFRNNDYQNLHCSIT